MTSDTSHEGLHSFLGASRPNLAKYLLERNFFRTGVTEKNETHFMPESVAVVEILQQERVNTPPL
jgi:hypothetical protein